MSNPKLKFVAHDVKVLVRDAQALFNSATKLTGDEAEELRARGMRMLEMALEISHGLHTGTLKSGKEMYAAANGYVKQKPLLALAGAAGLGVLVGSFITRKWTEQ